MPNSAVDDFLGNQPSKPAASQQSAPVDAVNSFLGNEPSVGQDNVGIDQRLADYDNLQKNYGGIGQQALTAVEGTAQGFAGPVATGAEALLSSAGVPGLTPEDQELRAKANPITRYGTEAVGFGLGALTGTGEAALLSRFGKAAELASGLGEAGKVAKLATRTGAELAAFQAGNEISKTINQDPNQTLGSAAINIGLSGIMGAAGGAALGQVGKKWTEYVNRSAENVGIGSAPVAEGEDLLSKATLNPKEKSKLFEGILKQKDNANEIREAGNIIGVPVSASQTSASDYVQSLDSALSQSPTIAGVQRQQEIAKGFDRIGQIIDDSFGVASEQAPSQYERGKNIKDKVLKAVEDLYQPLKEGYAARKAVGETIDLPDASRLKQYDKLIEISQKFGKASPETEKLVRDSAEGLLRQDTVDDLDEYLKVLSSKARNLSSGPTPDHYAANALRESIRSMDEFQVGEIAKQAKGLSKLGVDGAEQAAADIVAEHKAVQKKYAEFKGILEDLSSDSKLGKRATTAGGIENVLEDIPNEKLVDKMFDPKNSDGLKRLKEKFPDVFDAVIQGKKADLLAGAKDSEKSLLESVFGVNRKGQPNMSPEIRDLMFSKEEQNILKASHTWIDSLPKNVGPSGTPKGSAFFAALTSHPLQTIANNAKDIGIKSLLRFASPAEIAVNKASSNYLMNAIKGNELLGKAAKALFQTGEIIPQHLLPNENSRKRLNDQLAKINENPDNALDVGGLINHHLPNHAVAAGTMAASAVNYFNSIRPTETKSAPLDVASPKSKLKDTQYNRALDIAEQPLLVLQHAKHGTLQAQDIKTLQAVYPGLHQQMASKVSDQLIDAAAKKTVIPYSQRRMISMILGQPLDSTQKLSGVQSIMNSNSTQEFKQSAPQHPSQHKTSASQLSQINKVNKLYMTQNERRLVSKGK